DEEAGKTAGDPGVILEQEIQRFAASARTKCINPCTRVRQAMIRKATYDDVPAAQFGGARFADSHDAAHRSSCASNRRAAVISGGGENCRLPGATAPMAQMVPPMIATSRRRVVRRKSAPSDASLVLSQFAAEG